jgi:putative hydroxymethylpyrimidine transporter CytX
VASVTDRVEDVLSRETSAGGIRPVPRALRTLSGLDLAVLWGDLSIGLLVLVTGALLVPGLGLPAAVAAIGIGTVIGCLPLGLVAAAGAREGVPAMVLFRPSLGLVGSYLPSVANLVQLAGWTAFEVGAIARVANAAANDLFGVDAGLAWLVLTAVVCTGLALAGPVFAVRRWLEKAGIWILLGVGVFLTIRVAMAGELGQLWSQPGTGGLPFWLAVDLVIAMPVSWLPLVADYTRFGRDTRAAAIGSATGYAIGNAWFYLLGVLLVLAAGAAADPLDIGTTIAAAAGGGVVLLALLAGETDQAMANVYSAAVTVQNVRPGWSQRGLIVGVGLVGFAVAAGIGADAAATLEGWRGRRGARRPRRGRARGVPAPDRFGLRPAVRGVPGALGGPRSRPLRGGGPVRRSAPRRPLGERRRVGPRVRRVPVVRTDDAGRVVGGRAGSALHGARAPVPADPGRGARGEPARVRRGVRRGARARTGSLGGRRREHQQHDRGLRGCVAEGERVPGGDRDRLPLLQPGPPLADLRGDLAREYDQEPVGAFVRERPDALRALQADHL